MRLAWLTDLHLNFLSEAQIVSFARDVVEQAPDALLLTGEISEGPQLAAHLELLHAQIARPIYFVLGNHDFYRSSIAAVRAEMVRLTARTRGRSGAADRPNARTVLAARGRRRRADQQDVARRARRLGRWSRWRLRALARDAHDYLVIRELAGIDEQTRLRRMQELAAETATHLADVLPRSLARAEHASRELAAS